MSIDLTKAAGRQRSWSGTTFSFGLRRLPQPSSAKDPLLRRMARSFGFAQLSSPPADWRSRDRAGDRKSDKGTV